MQVINELRIGVKLRKVCEDELCDPSSSPSSSSSMSSLASSSGFKLAKEAKSAITVGQQQRRHVEYELTPFEILLDQIRTRRYQLKKVPYLTFNLIKYHHALSANKTQNKTDRASDWCRVEEGRA